METRTIYVISEFRSEDGQLINTQYAFTEGNFTTTFMVWEAYGTYTRRTVTLNDGSGEFRRSSLKALAEAKAEAQPVGYVRMTKDSSEELPLHDAVEAGVITMGDYLDLTPAEHEAPTLAAVPVAEPEAQQEAQPEKKEVTVERDCYPTVTVSTTKGEIVADVPHIGHGVYAVDYSNKQVATITPALHYATVRMNETREEFRAKNADEGAWSALARHLVARGYCVPDLG